MLRSKRGIPAFEQNAVLKLIIASGTGFVAYHLTRVIMLVAGADGGMFYDIIAANVAMPQLADYLSKFWTVLTYGWVHTGFWVLFSNMIWLYAFGSLVQMLIGHKQLIPMFIYCMVVGGIFYQLAQFLPGDYFIGRTYMLGAQGGIVGLSVAALTLAPDYKFYLTDTFKIPLAVVAIIFYALQVMNANVNVEGAPLFLLIGGAAMGYGYVWLLRNGFKPAGWVSGITDTLNNRFEPDDRAILNKKDSRRNRIMNTIYNPKPKQGITQNKIDDILDKINQKGYDSLTKEEKETLFKAGQDNE